MTQAFINQRSHEFDSGLTVLQALRQAGVEMPTLCHDDRLKPCGDCRMCLVEITGWSHLAASCLTPLADGMQIETHTPELEDERRALLAMMAARYPAKSLAQFPDKQFHQLLRDYDLEHACLGEADPTLMDNSHPYIRVDMSHCIDCLRCVRICREVQGQFVWQVLNRGAETRIAPDSGTTLLESSCVSCGACVDACPTAALVDKSLIEFGQPTEWIKTTCPYCGTGCEMEVGVNERRIAAIRPAAGAPVNKGHLCVKGRYGAEFVYANDRITEPMIREGDEWKTVSWPEAIRFTADRLRQIVEVHGADSVGVLGSARATNEENYLAQKFARVALGTNNVDCCARVCHAPTAAAMKLTLGTGAATNSFDDIELANTILLCGANATENHPIAGARIKQAKLRGAKLIVIDPRRIELAAYADIHLQLRPGTNVPLLNAMACTIVEEQLFDESFVNERVAAWPEFCDFIRQFSPESVADVCGVEAAKIRQAARLYATAKPAMSLHGLGMTEHTQGTEGVMCLVNLALITGNLGKRGAGVNPLRGQNNVQGSAHMGCEPGNLTGFVSLADGRESFESIWQTALPTNAGLNLMQMMDAADAGKLRALWAIGYDVFLTNANAPATERAMDKLELVIVQDMFLNETAKRFGHVFFPAASSFEKDGTFMNAERRVQRIRKAVEPVGNSKPDWQIICDLASAMGAGDKFAFASPEAIWNEVRSVWKAGRGIAYDRIEHAGLQWPCPSEDHPGTEVLHGESFPIGKRAALRRVEFHATEETTNEEFPFLLTTGRTLYHFNAGTMTLRTKNKKLRPADCLDISPTDAARLGLHNDQRVQLRSRYGQATLPIKLNPAITPGELFTTFHTAETFLNFVTSPHRDGFVGAPEYKVTAVAIAKIEKGEAEISTSPESVACD